MSFTFDAANNLNVTGSISASNPSVGTTGALAPTSATEIGIIVGGNLVGVSAANPVPISGTLSSGSLTNNNAAPAANNQGVLPALANAANPTWTEGFQVLESVDLSGNQRVKVNAPLPAGTNVIGHVIADSGSTTAVTGTVAVTQSTSPWVTSLASTTITGTVAENLTQVAGVTLGSTAVTNFGTAPAAAAVLGVNASIMSGTTALGAPNTFGTTAPTGNALGVNASLFIGTTLAINGGVAGSLAHGGTSANNTAITQNPNLAGAEVISQGTQPTAATSGNQRRVLASTEGALFVQEGNSNRFSCLVQAATVTTQCQAAPGAGLRAYITSVNLSNQAATVQTLDVIFGTGANCATGPTALTHKFQFGTNATTTSPQEVSSTFPTPLIPTAANAICVRPSAATAFGATITGFIAP